VVHDAAPLADLLAPGSAAQAGLDGACKAVLSLAPGRQAFAEWSGARSADDLVCLSGPEGGLSAAEDALARQHGFTPIVLGPRVLRAETAPLAVLSAVALGFSDGV
jgi:16S rRNA (uracil1498-N3)-methyltransferase